MSYGLDLFRAEVEETDDAGDLQRLKKVLGYADEQLTDVHRVQPFGLTSHAPAGSHGIAIAPRGQRDLVAMLGLESPAARPKNLTAGQTALYDDKGNVIRMFGASGVHVFGNENKLKIEADKDHVVVKVPVGKRVYLGGDPADGGTYARVQTEAGLSEFVWARIS